MMMCHRAVWASAARAEQHPKKKWSHRWAHEKLLKEQQMMAAR
jgi:hypothetical protein